MSTSHRTTSAPLNGSSAAIDPIREAEGDALHGTASRRADAYVQEVRRILARFGTHRTVAAGTSLFDPADTSRHLYIVESGSIDISLPEDPGRHPIATFHAGSIFLFDFGGYQVASLEAAEESVVIDLPFSRLDRLCRQEMELRLLLRQCHAFDLKSFLDVCYPARSRFRLAHKMETLDEPCSARGTPSAPPALPGPENRFMLPLGPGSSGRYTSKGRRRTRRRDRLAGHDAGDGDGNGET